MSTTRLPLLVRRVEALDESQRRRLAEAMVQGGEPAAAGRLVAYIETTDGAPPSRESLRLFMAERVPEYMIPAQFVTVDRLPRTAAGKVDRRALANSHRDVADDPRVSVAPRTAVENTLAQIWRDVLKIEQIGIDDDFFELGGDSLLSIRVIARAGREGIRILPEHFFERPTIRQLASGVAASDTTTSATGGEASVDATGEAPLTPIQHWFLETIGYRDWWNQSFLLELAHPVDHSRLGEIIALLVDHHAALRLRVVRRDGEWRQDFAPSQSHQPPLRVVNLHADARDQYQARVVEESEREQAAMRLAEGNLFRCVLFEGLGEWRRLLLVAHHLVVDAVSWNLILDDLARLVARAVSGESLKLPDHSASARQWALTLAAQATTLTAAASANYWLAMPSRENDLPPGISAVTKAHHRDVVRDAELLSIAFNAAHTRSLLKEAPRRLHATPHAILLAGVLLAWYRSGGGETLRLDVEAHGRDLPGIGLDVSRTVGWFTTVFPLELALPPSIANVEPSALAIVKAVQSVLDSVPLRGAAHGLQRYLSADTTTRARLAAMPRRTVLFNFLGAHDVAFESASGLIVSDEPRGRSRDPAAPRAYALELNSLVERGKLILSIEYSRVLHRKHAVQAFADRCREAFDAIAGTTTSGFGLAGFDASTLSTVAALLDTEEPA